MRIAVLDDSVPIGNIIVSIVQKMKHEAVYYRSSSDFLHSLKDAVPDLVIVDNVMPGMSGLELVKALRKTFAESCLPIMMITGNRSVETRYEALRSGVNDFITKPIDGTEVRYRVQNLLTVRQAYKIISDYNKTLQQEVEAKTAELVKREEEIVFRLTRSSEYRDNETGNHIIRVAKYNELIARRLGLDGHECRLIYLAAPMHDIGKLGIPDVVLQKPGPLDPHERAIMQTHTELGSKILAGSKSELIAMAAVIAESHHERWDGRGYPRGLKGDAIPLAARIVAVADVFDALTSPRVYKRACVLAP